MGIIALAVCVFVATIASTQNLQSFSGTWRVDAGKSQEKVLPVKNPPSGGPQIPPPPPANHEYTLEQIRQTDDVLKISGGEAGTTAVYTIDLSGKQVSDPIPDAPGVVRIASSHWEHGKIVTQWKMQRNGADRRRVDLEFCTRRRAAYLAQHDPDEATAHSRPGAPAEPAGVFTGRDVDQAVDGREQSAGRQWVAHSTGLGQRRDRPQAIGAVGR